MNDELPLDELPCDATDPATALPVCTERGTRKVAIAVFDFGIYKMLLCRAHAREAVQFADDNLGYTVLLNEYVHANRVRLGIMAACVWLIALMIAPESVLFVMGEALGYLGGMFRAIASAVYWPVAHVFGLPPL